MFFGGGLAAGVRSRERIRQQSMGGGRMGGGGMKGIVLVES